MRLAGWCIVGHDEEHEFYLSMENYQKALRMEVIKFNSISEGSFFCGMGLI